MRKKNSKFWIMITFFLILALYLFDNRTNFIDGFLMFGKFE